MNHNLETSRAFLPQSAPGGNYPHSLRLLKDFRRGIRTFRPSRA